MPARQGSGGGIPWGNRVQRGGSMIEEPTAAQVIARVLKGEGVEHIFGVGGGSIFPFMLACSQEGIRLVHFRHEQGAAFAADAYARAGRRAGVVFLFAGPGYTNASNGIAQAYHAHSPVVVVVGQHSPLADHRGASAPSYAAEALRTITKAQYRMVDERLAAYFTKKALAEALAYPPGPVVLEVPEHLQVRRRPAREQRGYLEGFRPPVAEPATSPAAIAEALQLMARAQRPVIVAGEQVYWDGAVEELRQLAGGLSM